MKMKNFASGLHEKGELSKIATMEQLQKRMEKESNNGLAGAFLTNGVYNFDVIAMLANKKEYENKQGYIFYDNDKNKAVFISDSEI